MAQRLRAHAALPEDLSWITDTNVGQLTTMYNSSSRESDILIWLSRALHSYAQVCSYVQPHTQICIKTKDQKILEKWSL